MSYHLLADADLKDKRVLLRAGFDLPMSDDGKVEDVTRVEAIKNTMKFIIDSGAVLIIMAHQGRPKNGPEEKFSQKPLTKVLEKVLTTTVHFASDCIGPEAEKTVAAAKPGEVVLLENLRFHPEEKKNDPAFSQSLAKLADIYVNDAFTNCHRVHASMVGVAKLLPAYMGFNLEQEIQHLTVAIENTERPVTLIIAGSKMETKVPVIERFLEKGDHILVGGCIANTLIAARGFDVGASKYDESEIELAQTLMLESSKEGKAKIHVPRDVVVANELSETAVKLDLPVEDILGDMAIYDVGKITIERYLEAIKSSKLLIWNGPLGVYEFNRFSHATKRIAEAIAEATKGGAISLIGGGDTIDFHLRYKFSLKAYSFVSMGGGAMLEFISGKRFESLSVLEK
ncbi:MAG: phosphoglycerate kinase [Candidatus Peribacteraceae bacterium]|nr:phosphoglycerate kinase [Candidatus Peribacteraceae bacterium]